MMLTTIHPKLPMRDKKVTHDFYVNKLGFSEFGTTTYPDYLMIEEGPVQIHFFEFKDLNPAENYGQVYIRTENIDALYASFQNKGIAIHPNGALQRKPWGQLEFSILDPDNNLLTFGQAV